jgi:PncC family amidohydrolase
MIKTRVDDHPQFRTKTDEELVQALILAGAKVRTAESCTGGGLMNRLTDVSGSSRIMDLSVLAYSPQVKQRLLRVPASLTCNATIVSKETAERMQSGLAALASTLGLDALGLDTLCWYVGITGWLGPAPSDASPELSDTVFVSIDLQNARKDNVADNERHKDEHEDEQVNAGHTAQEKGDQPDQDDQEAKEKNARYQTRTFKRTFCFCTAGIEPGTKAAKKTAVVHRVLLELACPSF